MKFNGTEHGKKIMIVDDRYEWRHTAAEVLRKNGYEIIEAANGNECLDKLKTKMPDLILMDIIMPGMDGWEVCKRIKENGKTKSIPVSMFSVLRGEDDIEKSMNFAHADAHLSKPVGPEELIVNVEKLLGASKLENSPVAHQVKVGDEK